MVLILHVGKLISNFKLCTTSWCAFRPADSSQILIFSARNQLCNEAKRSCSKGIRLTHSPNVAQNPSKPALLGHLTFQDIYVFDLQSGKEQVNGRRPYPEGVSVLPVKKKPVLASPLSRHKIKLLQKLNPVQPFQRLIHFDSHHQ